MKNSKRYLFLILFFFLFTSCYKEETYKSKRERTETVEVITELNEGSIQQATTKDQVNLRTKADVNSDVLSQVPQGTAVEILEEQDVDGVSWTRVIIENSAGYIQSQYITKGE